MLKICLSIGRASDVDYSTFEGRTSDVECPTFEEGCFGCRIFDVRRRVHFLDKIYEIHKKRLDKKLFA